MSSVDPSSIVLSYDSGAGLAQTTFGELDSYMESLLTTSIVFGVRVGLAAACLPVVFLITKNKKSPIFALNMACLVVLFVHSVMYLCTIHESYSTITYQFSGYLSFNQHDSEVEAATNTVYAVLIGLVECSMTYQIYVIFTSPNVRVKYSGYLITLVSALLGLTTFGLYMAYAIMANRVAFNNDLSISSWLINTPLICFAASSCVMSFFLLCKLALAIRTRKQLGLKQFGIFHVLFIMSFQTMIVPTVIILVSFHYDQSGEAPHALATIGLALITVSLPMSTMWVNSVSNSPIPTSTATSYLGVISDSSYRCYGASSPDSNGKFSYGNDKKITNNSDSTSPETLKDEDSQFWKQVELYADELDPQDLEKGEEKRMK